MISRRFVARTAAIGLVLAASSPLAFAATATGNIDVKVSVAKACSVAATSDVDFGPQDVSVGTSSELQTGGTISVRCRKQAQSVTVRLEKTGTNVAGGTMTSGGNSLSYSLYKPVTTTWDTASTGACQYSTAWDTTGLSLGGISSTGTMLVGVCAKTTIDDTTAAGDYSDTLTVVLDY